MTGANDMFPSLDISVDHDADENIETEQVALS